MNEIIKKYFDFEKKKHYDFFLPYYRQKNWIVHKDNINGNRKIEWDVELEPFVGKFVQVDEKARVGDYGDFLVEIIQNMKSGSLGWLYGLKIGWILYGSWRNINDFNPSSLYKVRIGMLKSYILKLKGIRKTCIAPDGWGITWNVILSWDELILNRVAEKLI